MKKFMEISRKLSGINVAKILGKFLGKPDKSWTTFVGNLKYILNKILGILEKRIENYWENYRLIISKIESEFKIIY